MLYRTTERLGFVFLVWFYWDLHTAKCFSTQHFLVTSTWIFSWFRYKLFFEDHNSLFLWLRHKFSSQDLNNKHFKILNAKTKIPMISTLLFFFSRSQQVVFFWWHFDYKCHLQTFSQSKLNFIELNIFSRSWIFLIDFFIDFCFDFSKVFLSTSCSFGNLISFYPKAT